MSRHDADSDAAGRTARRGWDFTLVMLTVGLLGALGAQSLLGTLYAWWAYRTQPDFEQQGYAAFIGTMNAIAGPLVIALVVVMGLCVPKRLFARRSLLAVSVAMIAGGAIVWLATGSAATGIAAYLVAAGVIQVAVVVLTLAGARNLGYVSEGRLVRTGSGVLHLGFILFALVVVGLQDSPLMLPVFAVAAIALTGGSVLAFYARSSARAPLPDAADEGD